MTAQRTALDASRWHFNHGPIDIVAEAHGDPYAVAAAHDAAWARFGHVLDELVRELPLLRLSVTDSMRPRGVVGARMWDACAAFSPMFITPMAAVAGSVAQELIAFYDRPGIERAWINNGGDIALHLAPGQSARVGVYADLARFDWRKHVEGESGILTTDGQFEISAAQPVRGVATSGWRGRSFSLGIADSVTVLAATAAEADAAATVIANAVDVDDAAIRRRPASECKDDSDLGEMLVTVDVPPLSPAQVKSALDTGAVCAKVLQKEGLAWAALLVCQGQWRLVEPLCSKSLASAPADAVGSVFA
uniref:ApbE family lipoprotein n=1 Tax=Variovorax paradoxus (strain S110) TaxID=543728 RepID=C5CX38_VARPS